MVFGSNSGDVIKPLIDDVKQKLLVGVKDQPVDVIPLESRSFPGSENSGLIDVYSVSLPIAGLISSWELHFDKLRPHLPPDVIFDSDKFTPLAHAIQGFANWKSASKASLSKLITELFSQYVEFNRNCIDEFHQLQQDWDEILSETDFAKHCEVCIARNGPGTFNSTVSFLFEIEVNLENIPAYLVENSTDKDKACLEVTFHPPDQTKVISKLFLSPPVETALGGRGVIRIPQYGRHSLAGYIKQISSILSNSIDSVTEKFEKRQELMQTIIEDYNSCVSEYDCEKFSQISLLLEHNGYYVNVMVCLSPTFPLDPPTLLLQSVYHKTDDDVTQQSYGHYNYNPRWSVAEIWEKLKVYLEEIIVDFQDSEHHVSII